MSNEAFVLYAAGDHVARITLNRPERRNPLGPALMGDLTAALERARTDPDVRVIVLSGHGPVFSAGGDLGQMAGASANPPKSLVELLLLMREVGKPIIARVHGHALAGGLGLAVACDLVIAADEAQFGMPEINVGLWPMMILACLSRNAPRKRILEMALTGERISAREAQTIGLVTRTVPKAELDETVDKLASTLAKKSPAVLRLGLRAFYATEDMSYSEALSYLEAQLGAVLATEDAKEGLAAFIGKRAPEWKGK